MRAGVAATAFAQPRALTPFAPSPRPLAGRVCEKCDGKCVVCDSYVRPHTLVRVCDECNFGSYLGRCVVCGGIGVSDAFYCRECVQQEKDVSSRGGGLRAGRDGACRVVTFALTPPPCSAARRVPQNRQYWR